MMGLSGVLALNVSLNVWTFLECKSFVCGNLETFNKSLNVSLNVSPRKEQFIER